MNIKDLPQGTYRPVVASTTPKLNINDLPPGSYKPVQQPEEVGMTRAFGKAILDPISKIGGSVAKTLLPKSLEGSLSTGQTGSVLGGKVDLVGYRDGRELKGTEFAKDVAGTVLEGASYLPMTGIGIKAAKGIGTALKTGKFAGATVPKVAALAAEGAVAGGLVGTGSALQRNEDVGTVLQEGAIGSTIGAVASPVVGALAPRVVGGIRKSIPELLSKEGRVAKTIENREKEIFDIESSYIKTKQKNAYKEDARSESRNRIAQTDVLVNSVDQDGKINTKGRGGAIDQYKELTINGREGIVRDLLQQEGKRVKLTDLQSYVEDVINKEKKLQGSSLENAYSRLNSTLAGLQRKADAEGYVPLETVHDTKIAETANIDYSKPSSKTEAKTVARGLKELIERESGQNVKEVNDELSKYYGDIEILEDLDGKRVKGGRLGKYFAQSTGNIVGALAGNAVGGPFGGAIGAVVGGEATAKIAGQQMSKTFGKAVGKKVPESKILKSAAEKAKQPKLALPAPKWGRDYVQPQSKSLGNLNAQYSNIKTANSTANISDSIPQNRQEVINNFNHYFESTDKPQIINYIDKEGNQVAYRTPTSMPKSLPDNLRKRELFNRVEPYWKTQVRPTKKGLEQQLYDELQRLVDKEIQNAPANLPKGDTAYFGATAGIQTDDEGNVTFDPKMAALGVAGMSVARNRDNIGRFIEKGITLTEKTPVAIQSKLNVLKNAIENGKPIERLAKEHKGAFNYLNDTGAFSTEKGIVAKDIPMIRKAIEDLKKAKIKTTKFEESFNKRFK